MNLFNTYCPIPICPYCDITSCKYDIKEDNKMIQLECPHCKKTFKVMRTTKVEYQVWK